MGEREEKNGRARKRRQEVGLGRKETPGESTTAVGRNRLFLLFFFERDPEVSGGLDVSPRVSPRLVYGHGGKYR